MLLYLHHGGALLAGPALAVAQGVFQVGQAHGLLFDLSGQQFGLFFGIDTSARQVFQLQRSFVLAFGPLGHLLGQRDQPLLHTLAAFHHIADFCFQPADFGSAFVQLGLRLVDMVAGRVVRLAHRLQGGFGVAQLGHARFQVVHGLQTLGTHARLLGLGVGAF